MYTDKKGTSKDSVRNAFNEARTDFPSLGPTAELSFNPVYMAMASGSGNDAITLRWSVNSNPIIVFSFEATYGATGYGYLVETSFHEFIHADGLVARNLNVTEELIQTDHELIGPLEEQYGLWRSLGGMRGGPDKPNVDKLPWRNSCMGNANYD